MKKQSSVLVSGANGFIAKNLIPLLLEKGYCVSGFDLNPVLDASHKNRGSEFRYFRLDLLNSSILRRIIIKERPEYVIHLAASIDVSRKASDTAKIFAENFFAALNLLNALRGVGDLKRVVIMGSADEYGQNKPPFRETMMPKPYSAYGLAKSAITSLSMLYHRLYQMPIVVLRPFLVYGPGQINNQLVPLCIRKCLMGEDIPLTSGEQTKDLVYVGDLTEAVLKAMVEPKAVGEIFNVCSGQEISVREVALLIKKVTGSKSKLNFGAQPQRAGENPRFFGSFNKAYRILGWRPKTPLSKGIYLSVQWQRRYILQQ